MKRRIAIFLSLCLLFSVTGCNEKQTSVTTETIPSESISETLEEEGTTTTTVASSEVTTTTTLKETTGVTTSSADTTSGSTQTTSVIPSESTRETTTSTTATEKPATAAPTATPTPKPTATPEPTATPTPEPTATPTPTPEPEPEPEPEVDISYYVQYAEDCAVNHGFELVDDAIYCYDTPIIVTSKNHDNAISEIEEAFDYYERVSEVANISMITIWYDQESDGDYRLFIGYA